MEQDSFVFIVIIKRLPLCSAVVSSIHEYEQVVPATITDRGGIRVRQDNVRSNYLDISNGNLSIVAFTYYTDVAATNRSTSSSSSVSKMRLRGFP